MRAREEDGQLVALVEGHHVLVVLVGGVVLQNNVSAPPSWLLSVQQLYQGLKVEFHHGGVGIGLHQREVDPAVGVEPNDHGYPRRYLLDGSRVALTFTAPLKPAKVCLANPGLVDIENDLLCEVHLKQGLGKLLAEDLVLHRVALPGDLIDAVVPEVQLSTHYISEHPVLYIDVLGLLEVSL